MNLCNDKLFKMELSNFSKMELPPSRGHLWIDPKLQPLKNVPQHKLEKYFHFWMHKWVQGDMG